MQEVFEKIVEKIKSDSSVKLYGSKNSGNYMIPVDVAIKIVKQAVAEYETTNNLCSCDCVTEEQKIKATSLDIIVTGTASKPYYEIKYKTLDGVTHIGYSSYSLENVHQWRRDCFEVVEKQPKNTTNFDVCCESMEAMAQVIDIAKIGWTKDQIMDWLQKEECEVPE